VADVRTGSTRLLLASTDLVIEAPNWTPRRSFPRLQRGGLALSDRGGRIAAGGSRPADRGRRIAAGGSGDPVRIDPGRLDDNNTDHLVSGDGSTIYFSSEVSGVLFAIPLAGGTLRQVPNERPEPFGCFLQGISPDGATLAYTGAEERNGRTFAQGLCTIPATGGDDVLISTWDEDSVGCEYSSDGQCLVSLSFPPGTGGHEANVPVIIRSMRHDGTDRHDVSHAFGGQGTPNVNSWALDGTHFAYVEYPSHSKKTMIELTLHREFGSTGLRVSPLCLGTSSWGSGGNDATVRELADAWATGTLSTGYLDTSNLSGDSLSEGFVGDAIRAAVGLRTGQVVQTKLDRRLPDDGFKYDQMLRWLEQSLEQLGVDTIQVLHLHDPEVIGFAAAMAPGGPVEALVAMKEQGIASSIGISGAPVDMLERFVETGLFDAPVICNRFTLVDRSAGSPLDK